MKTDMTQLNPNPLPSSALISRVMRSNIAKGTVPERILRSSLRSAGVRGLSSSVRGLPCRPDIVFRKQRIAVFVHGCFWHGCPKHYRGPPKTHTAFWKRKLELNKARDRRVRRQLRNLGWTVLEFWECAIRSHPDKVAAKVRAAIWSKSGPGRR